MIVVKLFIEIFALLLLFVLFRQTILKTFPVKSLGMPLSDQSKIALKRFRNRFLILFILLTVLFTFLVRAGLSFLFLEFHHRNGTIALIVDNVALLLPSVLIGLLLGTFAARWLNHRLQKDGLSFFFEGYTDELEGFDRTQLKKWQISIGLSVAIFLIVGQYNYRVRLNKGTLYVKTGVFEKSKSYSLTNIQTAPDTVNRNNYLLYLPDDTLYTNNFSGDKEELVAAINKTRQSK